MFIIGIRPASVRPDLIRPTATEPDATASITFDDPRRPGLSNRPKFPPRRPRPSNIQDGDDSEGDKKNNDLISLIPIDRQTNEDSKDSNDINDNLRKDQDDPRVLTGGPFIPNFGGGGRPGRPVTENRIPDKNTGRGSATLQKVKCQIMNIKS